MRNFVISKKTDLASSGGVASKDWKVWLTEARLI